jgi:hypothetical protein
MNDILQSAHTHLYVLMHTGIFQMNLSIEALPYVHDFKL